MDIIKEYYREKPNGQFFNLLLSFLTSFINSNISNTKNTQVFFSSGGHNTYGPSLKNTFMYKVVLGYDHNVFRDLVDIDPDNLAELFDDNTKMEFDDDTKECETPLEYCHSVYCCICKNRRDTEIYINAGWNDWKKLNYYIQFYKSILCPACVMRLQRINRV